MKSSLGNTSENFFCAVIYECNATDSPYKALYCILFMALAVLLHITMLKLDYIHNWTRTPIIYMPACDWTRTDDLTQVYEWLQFTTDSWIYNWKKYVLTTKPLQWSVGVNECVCESVCDSRYRWREKVGGRNEGCERERHQSSVCPPPPRGLGYLSCFWHQQSQAFWVVINQSHSDKLAEQNGPCVLVWVWVYSSVCWSGGGTLARQRMSRDRDNGV